MPEDFNPPFVDDFYCRHDLLLLEQRVIERGLNCQLDDRHSLHGSFGQTLHVAFGPEIRRAIGIGIARAF